MRKRTNARVTTTSNNSRTFVIAAAAFILAAGMAVSVAPAHAFTSAAVTAGGDQGVQNAPGKKKKYKATRPIVVDSQTGELRLPTSEELQQTVDTLATLTARNTDVAPTASATPGWSTLDLDGGFAGVMLARPNDDGSLETRCVFTFEEGAAFLGLVEDVQ
jgi:hypothetical protein